MSKFDDFDGLEGDLMAFEQTMDGVSLAGLFTGGAEALDRTTLAWHFPHYHASRWQPGSAIRVGDWKLVRFSDPAIEPQLFDLAADPGEATDLAADQPKTVRELSEALDAWLDDTGADRATLTSAAGGPA